MRSSSVIGRAVTSGSAGRVSSATGAGPGIEVVVDDGAIPPAAEVQADTSIDASASPARDLITGKDSPLSPVDLSDYPWRWIEEAGTQPSVPSSTTMCAQLPT